MLKHAISPPNTRRKPKVLNEAASLEAWFHLRSTWKQTTAAEARMEMLAPITKRMEAVPNGSILRPLVGSCMSQTDMSKPMVAVDRSNPPHMASLFRAVNAARLALTGEKPCLACARHIAAHLALTSVKPCLARAGYLTYRMPQTAKKAPTTHRLTAIATSSSSSSSPPSSPPSQDRL